MLDLQEQLAQAKAQRAQAQRKAAAANLENARLRAEVRTLRHKNFTLQRYIDNPGSQTGYLHRYEKAVEAMQMARDMLNPVLNGLAVTAPTTIEPARVPGWARVQFKKD